MNPPLFRTAQFEARELAAHQVPLLQALFDANPLYFLTVNGRPPGPQEAQIEFDELPPDHLGYRQRWLLGVFGPGQALEGVAIVVADLCAPGVWHIALFLMASARHGTGASTEVYHALEDWMRDSGAQWLRLGVVQGNGRAERFWQRLGYEQVRVREGVDTGGRLNTLRVMVKPLAARPLADYLAAVPRDQPDSSLP